MLERPVVGGVAEELRAERHAQGDQIGGVGVTGQRRAAALAGEDQEDRGATVGQPDIGRQRQVGAQTAADQQVGRETPAPDDGEEVAEQRMAAGGAAATVTPENQQAAGK